MSLSLKDACLKAVEQSKRIASAKRTCTYKTPCGWCTKWDKKCDRKIGNNTLKRKDPTLEYIKSRMGLPPLNTKDTKGIW